MKSNQQNNQQTKNQKPLLRRKAMKATRLTMIGIAAAAIIFGGCSRDNRITGPGSGAEQDINKVQNELTVKTDAQNNAARMDAEDDVSKLERFFIVAEVFRTDVEGGCFYLTEESGDNYTPVTPKSLSLSLGMVLEAAGYIDKDIQFFCGNGPAFVIEEYKILKEAESAEEDRDGQKASDGQAAATSAQDEAFKKEADKKKSISAAEASVKGHVSDQSTANSGSALTEDNAPAEKEEQKIEKSKLQDSAPWKQPAENEDGSLTGNRAPAGSELEPSDNMAATEFAEEEAPAKVKVKYESLTAGIRPHQGSADIRDGSGLTDSNIPVSGSEDSAPAGSELEESNEISPSDVEEDRAPGKRKARYLQLGIAVNDDADGSDADDFRKIEEAEASGIEWNEEANDLPSEDRAPQNKEDNKIADEMVRFSARPVPIIYDDAKYDAGDGVTALEGYTHRAKGGCDMLTTADKEVFQLEHDMDVLLLDGTYIRVTGFISTLPYMTCEEATVFHAETIKILKAPEESDTANDRDYSSASDADMAEYIEAKGVMHRAEPEGACWYFQADNGERYELIFSKPVTLVSGMKLKVKGLPSTVATFCQSGKALEVMGWEPIYENKF